MGEDASNRALQRCSLDDAAAKACASTAGVAPVALSSSRILLRPYQPSDAGLVYAATIESLASVGRWMQWCHPGYAEHESVAWIENCHAQWQRGDAYEFAMFDAADQYVGGAGINDVNRLSNFANLGYWIRESRQGEGFATEAVRLLIPFGFCTLGLTRIEIVAAVANVQSRRVAEKAGALVECIARNRLFIGGRPVDAVVHSLIPVDWPERTNPRPSPKR